MLNSTSLITLNSIELQSVDLYKLVAMSLIAAMWISTALIIVISDYYCVNLNGANAKIVHHYCVDHMLYLGMKLKLRF